MNSNEIRELSESIFKEKCLDVHLLPASGSNRRYYRIFFKKDKTILAAVNNELRENEAFVSFARHFLDKGLPVPKILFYEPQKNIYFISDLGNITLFDYIADLDSDKFKLELYYKKAVDYLLKFQFVSSPDYKKCFVSQKFDKTSMMWDLNYFKYFFLKLANVPFDEANLDVDFNKFCDLLSSLPSNFFLYRDFQSRNIIITENDLAFIDFQGGRQGALQYDLASLLYDSKANLSTMFRKKIFDYYLKELKNIATNEIVQFEEFFNHFVLLRIMQAFGAYGYRGYYEKKTLFLQSVPHAASNLNFIISNSSFIKDFPELENVFCSIIDKFHKKDETILKDGILKVDIKSFSYRKGYPSADIEHGGGFIFDCRSLPNPGREDRFKQKTGLDAEVAEWLINKTELNEFIDSCSNLVFSAINNYLERKFNLLSVAFGCTGGQHRSVFCADALSERAQKQFGNKIKIEISHREL